MSHFFSVLSHTLALLALSVALGGCSPFFFFGGGGEDPVVTDRSDQTGNSSACAGLNLSTQRLTVKQFRGIISCFNSNGSLGAIEGLTTTLEDEELEPFIEIWNRFVLDEPETLASLSLLFSEMEASGQLDRLLEAFAGVLNHHEVILSGIGLLYESARRDGVVTLWSEYDPSFLRILSDLSESLSPENLEATLSFFLTTDASKSISSSLQKIEDNPPPELLSRAAGKSLFLFMKGLARDVEKRRAASRIVQSIADGRMFRFLRDPRILGSALQPKGAKNELVRRAENLLLMLKYHFESEDPGHLEDFIRNLQTFYLPVPCVSDQVNKVAPLEVALGEWLSHPTYMSARKDILTSQPVLEMAGHSACTLDSSLPEYYNSLRDLVRTNAFPPHDSFFRALKEHQLQDLFIDIFAAKRGSTGFEVFVPALDYFYGVDLVQNSFLYLHSLDERTENFLRSVAQGLLRTSDRFPDETLLETVLNRIIRMKSDRFADYFSELLLLFAQPASIYGNFWSEVWRVHQHGDSYPALHVIREIMRSASLGDRLLTSVFAVLSSEKFQPLIEELSSMSTNGKLKQFVKSFFEIFYKIDGVSLKSDFANQHQVHLNHGLAAQDIVVPAVQVIYSVRTPCDDLRLTVGLHDQYNEEFDSQIGYMLDCVELLDPMLHSWLLLAHEGPGLSFLSDSFLSDPYFPLIVHVAGTDSARTNLASFAPLFMKDGLIEAGVQLVKPALKESRGELLLLQNFVRRELGRSDFPKTMRAVRQAFESYSDPPSEEFQANFVYQSERLKKWVANRECPTNHSQEYLQQRFEAIASDFEEGISNWEWNGTRTRRSWSKEEVADRFGELFEIVSRADSANRSSVVEAVLRSLRSPEAKDLGEWLIRRSSDQKPILYFFEDEEQPRVRLANGLDRFEILARNGDFSFPVVGDLFTGNYTMRFLGYIADSWGDLPREKWPQEIRAKYSDSPAPTLAETFRVIDDELLTYERLVGYPDLYFCSREIILEDDPNYFIGARRATIPFLPVGYKKRVFNLRQVISVISDNLPGAGGELDSGMNFFRRLSFELLYSSDPDDRDPSEEGNLLKLVNIVADLGILRQVGASVNRTDPKVVVERAKGLSELVRDYDFSKALHRFALMATTNSNDSLEMFYRHGSTFWESQLLTWLEASSRGAPVWASRLMNSFVDVWKANPHWDWTGGVWGGEYLPQVLRRVSSLEDDSDRALLFQLMGRFFDREYLAQNRVATLLKVMSHVGKDSHSVDAIENWPELVESLPPETWDALAAVWNFFETDAPFARSIRIEFANRKDWKLDGWFRLLGQPASEECGERNCWLRALDQLFLRIEKGDLDPLLDKIDRIFSVSGELKSGASRQQLLPF